MCETFISGEIFMKTLFLPLTFSPSFILQAAGDFQLQVACLLSFFLHLTDLSQCYTVSGGCSKPNDTLEVSEKLSDEDDDDHTPVEIKTKVSSHSKGNNHPEVKQ